GAGRGLPARARAVHRRADRTARRGEVLQRVTGRDPRPLRRPKGLQAVLFDMDGLLVDSEPLWFVIEREVAERLGAPWGEADQEALIGGSLERTVSYLLAKAGGAANAGGAAVADGVVTAGREDGARWLVEGMARLVVAGGLPREPRAARLLAGRWA